MPFFCWSAIAKNRTWARTKAGEIVRRSLRGCWGLKTGKPMQKWFESKTQKCKTHDLTISMTQWGSPTCFCQMSEQNEISKSHDFKSSPCRSTASRAIWIKSLLHPSQRESGSSEPKCSGTMLLLERQRGEGLYIHRLVGSTHLPNWRHSNYWSQSKQIWTQH